MLLAFVFPGTSAASLLGDEIGYKVALATGIELSGQSTVSDSWEVRFTAAGFIFREAPSFEIDIFSGAIEIRRLSEPYPFPITFTFSDLDWVAHPNAKLSGIDP